MTYREIFTLGGDVVGELVIPHDEEIEVTTELTGWRALRWKLSRRFTGAAEPLEFDVPPRACRVCGCTDDEACWPPCHWVDTDLCSACEHL